MIHSLNYEKNQRLLSVLFFTVKLCGVKVMYFDFAIMSLCVPGKTTSGAVTYRISIVPSSDSVITRV